MSEFLKCDAVGCDHVETIDEISAKYVGKACPKCGANLLTQEDCDFFIVNILPAIDAAKALGLVASSGPSDKAEGMRIVINNHKGDLRVSFKQAAKP